MNSEESFPVGRMGSATGPDHVHLRCFACGRVEEFATPLSEKLKDELAKVLGFQTHLCRFEAGGLCRMCRSQADNNAKKSHEMEPQPEKKER